MRKVLSSLHAGLGAGFVVVTIVMSLAGPAVAKETLPYRDPNTKGFIGLCDRNKRPVTSGSIYDQPFIWTAVSSAPAPKGYEKGKAVLIAFQPRQGVEPGLWSGRQLHASSTFTNPKHPMSQAVNIDEPLLFFTQAFPPRWDGLVQLRMYFAGRDAGQYRATYPATSIRVTGDRWSVVSGGTVACNVGRATSIATGRLPASMLASPPELKVAKGTAPPTSVPGSENLAQAGTDDGSPGTDVVTAGIVGVALLGSGAGGLYLLRRRRSGGDT